MKTKTVRVDELEGAALEWAIEQFLAPSFPAHRINQRAARAVIMAKAGPTVEVPAELLYPTNECPECGNRCSRTQELEKSPGKYHLWCYCDKCDTDIFRDIPAELVEVSDE